MRMIAKTQNGSRALGRTRKSRFAPLSRRESGQTLLEVALIIPVLLLLLIGIIEIGRLAYYRIEVSNAARAGAQFGAQNLADAADQPDITTAAQNDAPDIASTLSITSQQQCATSASATPAFATCPAAYVWVQVNSSYTLNTLFSYPGLPTSFTLNSQATMPVSQ
jgi:Flp pilus assembly protein TadG